MGAAERTARTEASSTLLVEVAFARPESQKIVSLEVPSGTTAREAVRRACMERYFPDLSAADIEQAPVGVFGRIVKDPLRHVLQYGERVEIYRPLLIDPKQERARRAARYR